MTFISSRIADNLGENTSRFGAVFFGALALIALNTWFISYNFNNLSRHEYWVTHTAEVEAELNRTEVYALDSMIGARGVLLAGDRVYLDMYRSNSERLSQAPKRIGDMTIDNPAQARNADLLEAEVGDFVSYWGHLVPAGTEKRPQLANLTQFFAEGKSRLDALRTTLTKMKEREDALMVKRAEALTQSKLYFNLAVILGAFLSALFTVLAFVFIRRNYIQINKEAVINAYEAKIKDVIALLSRQLAGELTAHDVAERTLQFLGSHFDFLSSHFYAFDIGGLKRVASYGAAVESELVSSMSNTLVGEAIKRPNPWKVKDIPKEYWKVKSGLGEAKPEQLLFAPIRFQDQNFAVLELGSFSVIDPETVDRIHMLAEVIGVSLNAAQSRDRLQELLERTQQQSEELQLQQEELRSNNEELEQQAHALEEQQHNLVGKNLDLEETRKQLELKARDLENSSKYKSEFLAKMSHELRTPLNSLLILSTLLVENKEKNLNDRQKQFAESIYNSGQDLLLLINDILDLSKIEAKKLRLKVDAFPVNLILLASEASFSIQAKSKGLTFTVDANDSVRGEIIKTDRQRLEQILRNFISNAIKFTDAGTVTLKVDVDSNSKRINFHVIDTGIGVPEDKIELIFEAFEQADGSVSRKYGGTGLGLTISKELAGLLDGTIEVKSNFGEGSAFTLSLPLSLNLDVHPDLGEPTNHRVLGVNEDRKQLEPNKVEQSANHTEAVSLTKGIDSSKTSILIIEDDERFRQSVVEAVKEYGFQAIECSSGELALEILSQFVPSAILLDIKLPEVSGFVLLEVIKGKPELRHVPVHIISGLEFQHNALRMGAMGYLTKPVTMEKISAALERIKGVISGRKRRILLIEDDFTQSQAISQIIEGEDLEVVTADTGRDALKKVKEGAFDCIILDLKLSDTSGFKLLEEFKHISASIPPIVIYTGKDLTEDEEQYLHQFSESIIIKGARSPERLLDEVNLFLHRVESLLPQDKKNILELLRSTEHSFENKTVLVVDDDLRNIFSMTSALESKGITVKIAKDGIECLEVLEKNANIDLVLMDIMMPRMDGYEAMKRIRASALPKMRTLPIVALTAKAMKGDYEKCVQAGANDYLPKPIKLESLSTVLKVWLSRRST